jgi:hypothetical protein
MGGFADLRKSDDPNFAYDDVDVDFAYQAWQASRAALKVELPQGPDLRAHGEFRRGHAVAMTEVTEALQQAGIEVK